VSARTAIVFGLSVFTLVLFGEGLYHLYETGSCGSGADTAGLRPCPAGTGWWAAALALGIIASVVLGIAAGSGALRWLSFSGLFLAGGVASLVSALDGSAHDSDATGAAIGIAATFIPVSLLPLGIALFARSRGARAMKLMTSGRVAVGTITDVQDTGVTINNNPRVSLTFQIAPHGEPEFTAHKDVTVSRVQIPQVGQSFPVWYDPADHSKFAYAMPDSADARSAIERDPERVARVLHDLTARAGAGTPVAPEDFERALAGIARAPDQGARTEHDREEEEDPLDRLKKLTELRDAGALTPTEFEVQKAKILADT
jgi:putative oligomerization/nucleic acid binding protein